MMIAIRFKSNMSSYSNGRIKADSYALQNVIFLHQMHYKWLLTFTTIYHEHSILIQGPN